MFSILIFVPYAVHVIYTINYKVMNDDAIDIRTFELIIISVFIIWVLTFVSYHLDVQYHISNSM